MDARVEPKPGQLWVNRSAPYDMRVLIGLQDEGPWWRCYDLDGKYRHICIPSGERKFLRWATPAECRAAGLDPDAVLPPAAKPKPERPEWVRLVGHPLERDEPEVRRVIRWVGDTPLVNSWQWKGGRKVWDVELDLGPREWEPAPPPAAQAAIDAYEARIRALEAENAELRKREMPWPFNGYIEAGKRHAVSEAMAYTEADIADIRCAAPSHFYPTPRWLLTLDAALRDAAEQRQRAERAEAGWKSCREAYTRESLRGAEWWKRMTAAEDALKAYPVTTPAPTQGGPGLTPEDRAWMDAAQGRDAHYDGSPSCRDTAKSAIAARERRKGV